ncbi:AsmA-like protein [Sulfitobacter guttiformis]|uniref:AsmA-like protein n=2 Tax=Sulfitobacter guttiformis TaxID=74349 RepID=A0A420DIQ7_9RHOB|nr:AsmA-like protein [Sulfitobacter guttiformis]
MADSTPPVLPEVAKPAKRRKPPHRRRGWFLLMVGLFNAVWSLLVMTALAAIAAVYFFYDRPVVLPDWVDTRIEERLAAEFPLVKITFGEVRLLMQEGWRPRVRLRNVAVSGLDGSELIRLSEVRIRLSMDALRGGKVKPAEVAIQGVFATVIREQDGSFALVTDFARGGKTDAKGAPLGRVVQGIDTVLLQPGIADLAYAEVRGLTLQFVDRRAGTSFTVDGGRMIAERADGALLASADFAVLGSGNTATTLSANYTSVIGTSEAQFGVRIDDARTTDFASQSPAFAWMGALRAPISGAVRSGVRADGTLAPLSATLQIGAGVVQPNEATQPIPFDGARTYFTYDAALGLLEFDELSVDSKWVTARAEGTASLTGLRDGALEALVGQFSVTQLRANPLGLYPEPVEVTGADIDFRLQTKPFKIDIGRLDIFDGPQTRHAFGTLTAQPEGWQVALDARADAIDADRIVELWPRALKTKTRDWLAANLLAADITNADFAFRLLPGQKPRTYLAFDYQAASVKFLRTLPPLTQARGHASMDGKRFVVSLDEGEVNAEVGGTVSVTRSSFILPDLGVKGGTPAIVRLNARGPLTAALWALDQPPMGVMGKTGLPVDIADGEAVVNGTLAFPLIKGGSPADVVFDVTGDLVNLSSDKLIKGRTLDAPRMALIANNSGVEIFGAGTLEGVPFDGRWQQPIGAGSQKSSLRGSAQLTPAGLLAFNVGLPEKMMTGSTAATVGIDFERGQAPRMTLRSDLRGATLQIPQIGWRKASGEAGKLDMAIRLGAQPEVTAISLSGAGLNAQGTITLAQGGGLGVLELSQLQMLDWLDVRAALVGQGAGRAPQVVVRSGRLDLRTASFGAQGGGSSVPRASGTPAPPMRVVLDRLQVTDTLWLQGLAGEFGTAGGLDGPFEARVNGGTGVSGRVVPQNGRTAVRLTSADAGGVLRSAGVAKQAVGGSLDLSLIPVGSGGAFDGQLSVEGISIRDAPSMAALVNSLSIVGLVNEMNGDGIYFDEVEAAFRLSPNRMTLTQGSATGASLGLSMDGVFETDTGQIAMQGVVTPVYLLNGIGSILTRKGEGLLGFNYSLSGNAKAPAVSVNPLSILAPGALRNIFRAPLTEAPQVDGETAPAPQEPAQTPVERRYEGR